MRSPVLRVIWKSSPGNVLHAEVSGSHTWATVVFLRHPSLRSRASKWWWLRVWSSFLFMAPSLKICKCFKMSLVVLLGEFLVGEWWSGVHVFTLDEFCQILGLNFTQRHPWRCFCRQLPHHPRPTAACAEQWSLLRPERLHYMSLLLDVMTISQHPWQNSANQGYRCFNIFRDFTRGGGPQVSMQENTMLGLCYRRQVIINVRTRMVHGEGSSWQF